MSVGVKGFRVGTGPRGNYVHMGLGGVYYRATLPPARRGVAAVEADHRVPLETPISDGLTEIRSGPVTQMAPANAQEILTQIAEAQARSRLSPLAGCSAVALVAVTLYWQMHAVAFVAAMGGIILYAIARRVDDCRRAVLLYDLDPEAERAFQRFCSSFDVLLAAERIWHIQAQGQTWDWKRNAGASSLVRRQDSRPSYATPKSIVSNINVPSFSLGQKRLFFFPDRILIFESKSAGAVEYAEVRMDARPTNFIEEERVPGAARVVGSTWRFVNKSGGPDRRFNNNRQLPICCYDEFNLGSASGLNEKLNVSRQGAAVAFATGSHQYREDLQALASGKAQGPTAITTGAILALPSPETDRGTLPRRMTYAGAALAGWLFLGATYFWSGSSPEPEIAPAALAILPASQRAIPPPKSTASISVGGPQTSPANAEPTQIAPVGAPPSIPLQSTALIEEQVLYTTTRVNMRTEPTASSVSTGVIDRGVEVLLLTRQGDWRRIRVGDFEGWVNGKYLSPANLRQRSERR